jgi:hypothetical protein
MSCRSFYLIYFPFLPLFLHREVLYGKIYFRGSTRTCNTNPSGSLYNRSIKSERHLHCMWYAITVIVEPCFFCATLILVSGSMYYLFLLLFILFLKKYKAVLICRADGPDSNRTKYCSQSMFRLHIILCSLFFFFAFFSF